MSPTNLLAERLRQVIEDRLVDDAEAWCEAAGLSRGFLSSFFVRAKGSPGASLKGPSASALAAAAGVRTEWLLTGEGPRERRAEQTVELDGDLDFTIVKVGKAIGADPRDIKTASDARAAWGTSTLTEASAKNLIVSMAAARVGHERDVELEELRAAAGVKPITRGATVLVDDDDLQPKPKPRR